MWPCFSKMLEGNTTTQDKISYLRAISFCQNLRLENEEDVKRTEALIQELINSPLRRYEGLLVWNCVLSKSNAYLPNWGKILAAGLQCNDSYAVKEQCSIVLQKIVQIFGKVMDYSGAFQRYLPELIPIFLADNETNQGFVNSCESLSVCMTQFPKLLGPFMAEVVTFIMSNLNTESIQTIEALADLFSALPRCVSAFKPKESLGDAFLTTFGRTVNTLHCLLNEILSFQKGNFERLEVSPRFEVPCDSKDEVTVLYNKIRSFASLSRCLAKMMSSQAKPVRVSVEDLLGLIKRMFDFEFNAEVNNQHGEQLALIFLSFPKICDSAFLLLEALVLNFSVEEQFSGIMTLLINAVEISRTSPNASLFYSQVRSTAWKFLNIWLQQCGTKVTNEMIPAKLVKELLLEIALHSTEVNDQIVQLFHYSSCIQALKALTNLHISGSFFEEKEVEDVYKTLFATIRKVQLCSNPAKSIPCPYSNEKCRVELYNLLLTCSITGNPSHVKYTLKSVNLFKMASRDPSIKVKEVCHRAFALYRYYLHPKKPPPDYIVNPKPVKMDQVIKEDNVLDDWGTGWQNGQLNGHAPAAENDVISSYPGESSYPEDTEASEMAHDEQTEQDSPSGYTELGPVNINKKRTLSRQSSPSYGEDSDSDDDKDSSFEEEEQPPRKKAYTVAAHRPRPTILQISETHRTDREQQQAEDSMELGAAVEKAMPELSDGYEEEEDIAMAENGEPEESEDLEDEYLEEEEAEEEYDTDLIEERHYPQTKEPSPKRRKDQTDELTLEKELGHTTEREEEVKSECQGPARSVDHEEEITSTHQQAISSVATGSEKVQEATGSEKIQEATGSEKIQEATGSEKQQEATGSEDNQKAIGKIDNQKLVENVDLQVSICNDDQQNVESNNPQSTLSTDGPEESCTTDNYREEAKSNQEINGENEDSDESSSNEV